MHEDLATARAHDLDHGPGPGGCVPDPAPRVVGQRAPRVDERALRHVEIGEQRCRRPAGARFDVTGSTVHAVGVLVEHLAAPGTFHAPPVAVGAASEVGEEVPTRPVGQDRRLTRPRVRE